VAAEAAGMMLMVPEERDALPLLQNMYSRLLTEATWVYVLTPSDTVGALVPDTTNKHITLPDGTVTLGIVTVALAVPGKDVALIFTTVKAIYTNPRAP
jgi:hypothetical protein